MRQLSVFLRQHVVAPLNEMGVAVDLRDVQLVMLLLPVGLVVAAFMHASWKKRQRMKDAGM
jgi:cytochrome c oxidase subunit IV